MPSEKPPSSSSSSDREKEKARAQAAAAAAAGGKPPSGSSSSSSSKPSSSGSGSASSSSRPSGSSSAEVTPNQPAPYISANAWMSFFLFVCLVLVILQGPLGLSGPGAGAAVVSGPNAYGLGVMGPAGMGWMGNGFAGLPGCGGYGFVGAALPWCPPQPCLQTQCPPLVIEQQQISPGSHYGYSQAPSSQMGGQGGFATPGGGAGWNWYSTQQQDYSYERQASSPSRAGPAVQYQRPGMQIQVGDPGVQVQHGRVPARTYSMQHQAQPAPAVPVQPVAPVPAPALAATMGLANLENAFYPLLVAAIALLVIFDYCS